MHPAFETIRYGPFSTSYHQSEVNSDFRESLGRFLESELLPQVDEAYETTDGVLTAEFDEERFCGPNSAVRDAYRLKFRFVRGSGADEIEAQLYREKSGEFRMRFKGKSLILWTARQREAKKEFGMKVQDIVDRILRKELGPWICPHCGAELGLIDSDDLFDLTCPRRCFTVSYHRDPSTREFMHGHYFSGPPF